MGQKRFPGLRLSRQYLGEPLHFSDETSDPYCCIKSWRISNRKWRARYWLKRHGSCVEVAGFSYFRRAASTRLFAGIIQPVSWVKMYAPSEMRSLVMAAGFENVVHLDAPRDLLGRNIVARAAMRAALRLTRWDWLSATANCQASKP